MTFGTSSRAAEQASKLLKESTSQLILGRAALQRCDKQFVFTSGFSRRGQALHHEDVFQQQAMELFGIHQIFIKSQHSRNLASLSC